MAALTSASVTYAISGPPAVGAFSTKSIIAKLTFGDGALTYPAGGIPILGASLGMPNVLSRVDIFDVGASGYVFQYDSVAQTIRMYRGAASVSLPLLEITTSIAPISVTIGILATGY